MPSSSSKLSEYSIPFKRDKVSDGDFESLLLYSHRGFHPVRPGEIYCEGRYKILRKIGYGSYSTVWLTEDLR
jgi:hypothetical protein